MIRELYGKQHTVSSIPLISKCTLQVLIQLQHEQSMMENLIRISKWQRLDLLKLDQPVG